MTDDKLIAAKQADNFTTESPIRAFTDFQVSGTIAIGKGFRPSLAHLARYLDAMESKEGWRFVQIVLPQDDKGDPTIIFHRSFAVAMTVPDLPFDPRAVERILHPAAPALVDPSGPAADDPVNPKHYGGTACAEIGELLSANSYQVLKYNWRLGEKDDPVVELGKSLWYLDRELALIAEGHTGRRDLPDHGFFDSRLTHGSDHAQAVGRILISWNRYHNAHSLHGLRKLLNKKLEELKAVPAPRKVGGGPVVPAWMEHASDAPIPDDHYVQAAEYVIRRIFTARNQANHIDGAIRDFTKRFAPPKNHNCTSHVGLFRQLDFILHGKTTALRLKQLIDAYRQEQKLLLCEPHFPVIRPPSETPLLVRVTSNFGREHETSAILRGGEWFVIVNHKPMRVERMSGEPLAWRSRAEDAWKTLTGDPYAAIAADLGRAVEP